MGNAQSNRRSPVSRRAYLKAAGAGSLVGIAGLAGCTVDTNGGGGGGDGDGENAIIAGTAPGFPPFELKNEQGELVGFDIDLLEAVVAETDYSLSEWREFEFDSLITALQNDRIDVIAAAMTITPDRRQTISFTDPYYNADQSVLVRRGGDFQPESLDDLSGRRVGAQEGTTGDGVVQDRLVDPGKLDAADYNAYGNYVLAVEDLENGNIDAVVLDRPVAETFAQERDVEVAFTVKTGERYGFGVRQNDDSLRTALNDGLQAVRESGRYEEIRNEWFGGSPS
ncbi:basic amino acid ABC transporter substrate-binding protein [Halegenticoccus tardaugens]|uniref:basic amino acid ABC transporter substrate-binding protein n=1 Tax=Halegenticoccus tardaugens TaxID=2071624 RepID=UPI00100A52F6|nr:basic amino acid ABC transporter substrate-binding protein [Halegenticoccus tardaugens]